MVQGKVRRGVTVFFFRVVSLCHSPCCWAIGKLTGVYSKFMLSSMVKAKGFSFEDVNVRLLRCTATMKK